MLKKSIIIKLNILTFDQIVKGSVCEEGDEL